MVKKRLDCLKNWLSYRNSADIPVNVQGLASHR